MARRPKQPDLAGDLHQLFLEVPAWLCLPVAAAAYVAVQAVLAAGASTSPIFRGLAQSGHLFGTVAACIVLVAGLTAAVKKAERRTLFDKQRSLESIRALTWIEFEQLTGEAYRRQGYRVTETGGGGADGGIDLILQKDGEKLLVQCKQWRTSQVGVKPVRELYGVLMAEGAHGAVFVSSGTYTRDAKDFAFGKPLKLVDGDALLRLVIPASKPMPANVERVVTSEPPPALEAPKCPDCARDMVKRTARRGANAGAQFWGCTAYPRCRGTRQLAA